MILEGSKALLSQTIGGGGGRGGQNINQHLYNFV